MIDVFGLGISFLFVLILLLVILWFSISQRNRDLAKLRLELDTLIFEWFKEVQERIEVLEKKQEKHK